MESTLRRSISLAIRKQGEKSWKSTEHVGSSLVILDLELLFVVPHVGGLKRCEILLLETYAYVGQMDYAMNHSLYYDITMSGMLSN